MAKPDSIVAAVSELKSLGGAKCTRVNATLQLVHGNRIQGAFPYYCTGDEVCVLASSDILG